MKNGTSITGTYKELDPISHITIVMANHDVVIPMSEILEIEELAKSSDSDDDKHRNENAFSLKYGQYSITDNDSQYPDSINVTIGGQKITMLLVRGGTFNMGYNGWHSRSYNSEPVHRVTLSSFYVSENYINMSAYIGIYNNKSDANISKKKDYAKPFNKWNDINDFMIRVGKPYRVITEAEWEYVSLLPLASVIFNEKNNTRSSEWCSDYFGEYDSNDQINPQGASIGKHHVLRKFSKESEKWRRYSSKNIEMAAEIYNNADNAFIRLAVDAQELVNINK
jgi:hypothetical protein